MKTLSDTILEQNQIITEQADLIDTLIDVVIRLGGASEVEQRLKCKGGRK